MTGAPLHGPGSLKGLRFEALGRWPGMRDCIGMYMAKGHVIRLRASHVNLDGAKAVIQTVAHELGHTEQEADGKKFKTANEYELDVQQRLGAWGFDPGDATEDQRDYLLTQLEEVMTKVRELDARVRTGKLPSPAAAHKAHARIDRALANLCEAGDAWEGRG
jgi:hypothetical protein